MEYTYNTYDEGITAYRQYLANEHKWSAEEIDAHLKDEAEDIRELINSGWEMYDIFYYFE